MICCLPEMIKSLPEMIKKAFEIISRDLQMIFFFRQQSSVLGSFAAQAGSLAERESDVFSESRASLLVKGFENTAPAQVPCAPSCASPFVSFGVIRG